MKKAPWNDFPLAEIIKKIIVKPRLYKKCKDSQKFSYLREDLLLERSAAFFNRSLKTNTAAGAERVNYTIDRNWMPPGGTNRRLSLPVIRSTLRERLLEILPDAVCPSRTLTRLYFLPSKKLSRATAPSRISRKVAVGRDYFSLMHLSHSLPSIEFRKRLLFLFLGFSRRDLSNQPIDRPCSDTTFDKVCRRRYWALR